MTTMRTIRQDVIARIDELRVGIADVAKALRISHGHFRRYLKDGDMSTVHLDRLLRLLGYSCTRFLRDHNWTCRERILRAARIPESEWAARFPPPALIKAEKRRRSRDVTTVVLTLEQAKDLLQQLQQAVTDGPKGTQYAGIVESGTTLHIRINPFLKRLSIPQTPS